MGKRRAVSCLVLGDTIRPRSIARRELIGRQTACDEVLHGMAEIVAGAMQVPTFWDVVDAELTAREICRIDLSPGDEDVIFDQWAERQKKNKWMVLSDGTMEGTGENSDDTGCRVEQDGQAWCTGSHADESSTIVDEAMEQNEPPAGWEDLIYETWRDNQFERALRDEAPEREVAA